MVLTVDLGYSGGFTVCLFIFINGMFFGYMYAYGADSTGPVWYALIAMYLVQQAIMCSIFLVDPGVAAKQRIEFEAPLNENQAKYPPLTRKYYCQACDIIRWAGVEHCPDCGVCISEMDHHCPWTSKCIGAGNTKLFYGFVVSTLSMILVLMVCMVYTALSINAPGPATPATPRSP